MTRRVFGRVHQQSQHRARQLRTPYFPRCCKRVGRSPAQLLQRSVDLRQRRRQQLRRRWAGRALRRKGAALLVRERFSASIGQEAIEAADEVAEVIAGRRGCTRTLPQLGGRSAGNGTLDVFAGLKEGVSGGHECRGVARERAAQPHLGETAARHQGS
jgi:hypothetical protein